MQKDNVVFRRIGGRVVPIKIKNDPAPKIDNRARNRRLGIATAAGTLAMGGAVFSRRIPKFSKLGTFANIVGSTISAGQLAEASVRRKYDSLGEDVHREGFTALATAAISFGTNRIAGNRLFRRRR